MASITREQYRTYGTARFAQQLYNEHLRANHPDFAAFNRRMQWYYRITTFLPIVPILFLVGQFAGDRVGNEVTFYGLLTALSIVPAIAALVVGQRGKKRFRELWKQDHPSATSASDSL